MNNYKPPTPAKPVTGAASKILNEEMEALHHAGYSIEEIAQTFGMTYQGAQARLRKMLRRNGERRIPNHNATPVDQAFLDDLQPDPVKSNLLSVEWR